MKHGLAVIMLLLGVTASYGQQGLYHLPDEYIDDPLDDLTYTSIGANFLSNNVYMGRKDTVRLPYASAYVGYNHYTGLYVKGIASYAYTNRNGQFDLLSVQGGWDHLFGNRLLAGLYGAMNFNYRNSKSVRSDIQQSFGGYARLRNNWIEPQISVTSNSSAATDIVWTVSAEHRFRFVDNSVNIIPTLSVNAGSKNFYNTYMSRRILKKTGIVSDNPVQGAENLKPLSLELSGVLIYRTAGGMQYTLTPTLIAPLGASTIRLPGRVVKERLTNSIVVELDICYRKERK